MAERIPAKKILSKLKDAPDLYFGISYNMNLYRGCQHQCIYCDSRSNVYQLGNLAHIRIKYNAIELLNLELKAKRKKATIGTGSMNDPYMPIEKEERLTQQALKLIAKYKFPIHVITKSNLVLRDTDLLQEIKSTYAAVSLTITTPDDNLCSIIEPGAVVSSKRFRTIEKLTKSGLYAGIILCPVLPYLTDKPDAIQELIQRAKDSGAQYLLGFMGMSQRDGQREYYYNKLDNHFPGIRGKYEIAFGANYNCNASNANKLYNLFYESCERLELPVQIDFYTENLPQQLNLF